jgi:hypothetical protein
MESALTSQERIGGYLKAMANLAYLGAVLRTKYKDISTDYDEGWSEEEEKEWYDLADKCDYWFYLLKSEEHEWLKNQGIIHAMSIIARGENPCG